MERSGTKVRVFVTLCIFDPICFGLKLCKLTKELYMAYVCPVIITYVTYAASPYTCY